MRLAEGRPLIFRKISIQQFLAQWVGVPLHNDSHDVCCQTNCWDDCLMSGRFCFYFVCVCVCVCVCVTEEDTDDASSALLTLNESVYVWVCLALKERDEDRYSVCVCVFVDVVSGRDPAVRVPRASACGGLWDTAQQQGDKRHFNDLLRWSVTSCSPTFLPPRGDTGSEKMLTPETTVVTKWEMFSIEVKVHRNSVFQGFFFFWKHNNFFFFSHYAHVFFFFSQA